MKNRVTDPEPCAAAVLANDARAAARTYPFFLIAESWAMTVIFSPPLFKHLTSRRRSTTAAYLLRRLDTALRMPCTAVLVQMSVQTE